METIGLVLSLLAAYFVHQDARKRGVENPALWAIATFLVWIVFLPIYWYKYMKE